jgi:hypothetical protein
MSVCVTHKKIVIRFRAIRVKRREIRRSLLWELNELIKLGPSAKLFPAKEIVGTRTTDSLLIQKTHSLTQNVKKERSFEVTQILSSLDPNVKFPLFEDKILISLSKQRVQLKELFARTPGNVSLMIVSQSRQHAKVHSVVILVFKKCVQKVTLLFTFFSLLNPNIIMRTKK